MTNTATTFRLPDFLIVGTQKGGTSAMVTNLREHPQIFLPKKEVKFFTRDDMTLDEYGALFPPEYMMAGEKTPQYMSNPTARERIRETVPDAKLIILLRDPVARFHSAYNHYHQVDAPGHWDGWGKRSAEEMVAADPLPGMIARGFYLEQIQAFLDLGFSRDQIYIAISERVRANMEAEYNKVFFFLDLCPFICPFTDIEHSREYDHELSAEARERLLEIYRPHNERLFEFIGEDVPEWTR